MVQTYDAMIARHQSAVTHKVQNDKIVSFSIHKVCTHFHGMRHPVYIYDLFSGKYGGKL